MNKNYSGRSPRPGGKKPLTIAGVLGAILLVGYVVAQPQLNERFGWNLPSLTEHQDVTQNADHSVTNSDPLEAAPQAQVNHPDLAAEKPNFQQPTADSPPPAPATEVADQRPTAVDDPALRYGFLRQVDRDRFISPAGLQYLPGSQEGHRLEHLKRHTEDQPNRPGSHGVFDGGMEAVVRVLDQVYLKAKQKTSGVTIQQDQDRTIYTVDMGKRIGYVGGREGNRRRKPMARRVRLVLEGTRVITAYPL